MPRGPRDPGSKFKPPFRRLILEYLPRFSFQLGAEDAPLLRNLCSEDDWDAALQDLYMLSTMEEGRAAVGAVGSMLVRLDVLVRAGDDAEAKRSGKAKSAK